MAVLPHEGKYSIMYGSQAVPVGSAYRHGYLARPDEAGRFPTVVLLPGSDGMDGFTKHFARRLGRSGLACLVVDLYGGDDPLDAYHARTDKEVLIDIDETFEFLQSDDVFWALGSRVGLLGLDLGGRYALIAGAHRPWVGALALISAPLTGDEDRDYQVADLLNALPGSVLGLYGAADDLIAPETVDEAQNRNQSGTWLLYDGAGHWFYDDDHADYLPAAGEDAFVRVRDFFLRYLPPAETEDVG
ncbi:MAG TPA: dienelactone hydrolase family protein [Acidimicrobiia bacterium]|nr:dienelactone hydrolase family protein [Acidimicrobiia bacterium]